MHFGMRIASAAALLLGAAPAHAQFANPLFRSADPSSLVVDGKIWIYPTDAGRGDKLWAWESDDFTTWTKKGELLNLRTVGWANDDRANAHFLWAPDMHPANGKYYLYYSVGPQNPTPSRLGVAVCDTPAGPCIDSGKPLLTGGNGFEAIDPMVFTDPKSGKTYLYAGGSAGATLRVFTLKPDLVSIDQEVKVDQPPKFTEGVFMHVRNGIYYLTYSVGHWDAADYAVHYAVSLSPTGPWRYGGPILEGDRKYKGPGHHSIIQDPRDGSWLIIYHRWEGKAGNGPFNGDRSIAIDKLEYGPDGRILPVKMTGK